MSVLDEKIERQPRTHLSPLSFDVVCRFLLLRVVDVDGVRALHAWRPGRLRCCFRWGGCCDWCGFCRHRFVIGARQRTATRSKRARTSFFKLLIRVITMQNRIAMKSNALSMSSVDFDGVVVEGRSLFSTELSSTLRPSRARRITQLRLRPCKQKQQNLFRAPTRNYT